MGLKQIQKKNGKLYTAKNLTRNIIDLCKTFHTFWKYVSRIRQEDKLNMAECHTEALPQNHLQLS